MKMQFSTALLGYNRKQVMEYIKDIKKEYESDLSKQKDRLLELIEENRKLKNEVQAQNEKISQLKEQEKYITKVLVVAEQRAQSIIEEGKRRSLEELNRLKAEKQRWTEKQKEIRSDLLDFEKTIVHLLEKFRDDINYYASQEISESLLIDDQVEEKQEKKVIA
ncbi:MAG TPA: DivIVA domain-containing protein [Candidatus Atribacteria bacterium]|nr:DivIVA domain-containing protein [Candidatus Atribacteria bacterium]HPT77758.1 DivIVA domain-containing protein [Candidatus Atribacteria bacterium]